MNFVVIGDIHGRSIWKKICAKHLNSIDKIIFLGDYVSSYSISPEDQIWNLKEILSLKEQNKDKIVLLRGNHDIQHLGYPWAQCSGFESKVEEYLKHNSIRFLENTQFVYKYKNILFSHAGISNTWLRNIKFKEGDIEKYINNLPITENFGFIPNNYYDFTGTSKTQSCTWIRPSALIDDLFLNYIQIVGHTTVKNITFLKNKLILCDALGVNQYLYNFDICKI